MYVLSMKEIKELKNRREYILLNIIYLKIHFKIKDTFM